MYGETLPNWFWAIYYLFLLTTFVSAIISITKKKRIYRSILAILFAVIIPVVSVINSVDRAENMNEFEHLVSQFQNGAIWSVFTIIGYLFLIVWWMTFNRRKAESLP
ncbi:hypothetical protein SAMN04487944_12274 [Gracilibacillus ureilyticus]|uniref:Uncharacterized protein n=1 Tax=Gracilibacillus ureilyticus TaxID=531814 RepID=A0A1H9VAC4_9BACI|nr:hypothetical protein [Gracilibacillus ureilyticus]SES18716.1 hypothetical protein SAMN04487944_12274 [Gracilibacillus ureilyticus]